MSSIEVKSAGRKWRLAVPTGIGFSLLAVTQWRYLQKHGYPFDVDDKPELLNDVVVILKMFGHNICIITHGTLNKTEFYRYR